MREATLSQSLAQLKVDMKKLAVQKDEERAAALAAAAKAAEAQAAQAGAAQEGAARKRAEEDAARATAELAEAAAAHESALASVRQVGSNTTRNCLSGVLTGTYDHACGAHHPFQGPARSPFLPPRFSAVATICTQCHLYGPPR